MRRSYTPDELLRLSSGAFSHILVEDAVLRDLEFDDHDRQLEAAGICELLGGGELSIGTLSIRPLTAAKWALLGLLSSPFVYGGTLEEKDFDLFLYVLAAPESRCEKSSPEQILAGAKKFSARTGLTFEEQLQALNGVIYAAFAPLEMLPPSSGGASEIRFDAQWLIRIGTIAARESMTPMGECLHRMSLSVLCGIYVEYYRRNSADGKFIRKRISGNNAEKLGRRIDELAEKFLAES